MEAFLLYKYKKCLHCNKKITDPVIIYKLKIKICRQCIVDALISNEEFEKTYFPVDSRLTDKRAIIKAVYYSVDFMQLKGSYLSFDLQYDSMLSHVLFFYRKDIDKFAKELKQIPNDNLVNWLQERENIVHQYQKNILKAKHPLLNDKNIELMLSRASFCIPSKFSLATI
ncbi:23307_t:CDS:2 [Racocetra persica]|uniref:23307_t:CDS:1 n=1 Tax=Racocetra persica TaxID=160502 RepID=A0ACA9M367_9GLOM|nr:23307_t:CDS:2 [Racocetra persica]